MARPLRLEFPGAVYHVTSRGNQGLDVFPDDAHRDAFLGILSSTIKRYNWICHGYCLMANHYHLLIETPDGNLSKGMRQVNAVYTQFVNRKSGMGGHLFQGRYKGIIIEKDSHLLEVIRYVLLNPVRAGLVASGEGWPWSSYRGTCGIEPAAAFLSVEWILGMFGKNKKVAIQELRSFVAEGLQAESPWRRVKGQVILGGDAFCTQMAEHLKGLGDLSEVPRAQRLAGRPQLEQIFAGCTRIRERDAKIVEAVTLYGYSQKAVADYLRLHYSSISRIMTRLEVESKPKFKREPRIRVQEVPAPIQEVTAPVQEVPPPVQEVQALVQEVQPAAAEPQAQPEAVEKGARKVKPKEPKKGKSKEKEQPQVPAGQLSLF